MAYMYKYQGIFLMKHMINSYFKLKFKTIPFTSDINRID